MKDKSKNRFHRSDLAVFFSFFRPHLGLFALDMSCAIAVAVIDLAFPYITRVSMQTLLPEKLYTTFFVIMAAYTRTGPAPATPAPAVGAQSCASVPEKRCMRKRFPAARPEPPTTAWS